MLNQGLTIGNLQAARATQYLDLLWGHSVHCGMSDGARAKYESDKEKLSQLVGKQVKISLSIEEVS